MRYSHLINGYTAFNLTKLDVLDQLKEIKVCTGYLADGKLLNTFPCKKRINLELHLFQADNLCCLQPILSNSRLADVSHNTTLCQAGNHQ